MSILLFSLPSSIFRHPDPNQLHVRPFAVIQNKKSLSRLSAGCVCWQQLSLLDQWKFTGKWRKKQHCNVEWAPGFLATAKRSQVVLARSYLILMALQNEIPSSLKWHDMLKYNDEQKCWPLSLCFACIAKQPRSKSESAAWTLSVVDVENVLLKVLHSSQIHATCKPSDSAFFKNAVSCLGFPAEKVNYFQSFLKGLDCCFCAVPLERSALVGCLLHSALLPCGNHGTLWHGTDASDRKTHHNHLMNCQPRSLALVILLIRRSAVTGFTATLHCLRSFSLTCFTAN